MAFRTGRRFLGAAVVAVGGGLGPAGGGVSPSRAGGAGGGAPARGVVALAVAVGVIRHERQGAGVALPLREVGQIRLPGGTSRFDYASLDSARGLLFIAHLGASEIIEVDVRAGHVVWTIPGIADVHG